MPYRDNEFDELDDEEYPDPEWTEDANGTPMVHCPHCGLPVYEQAERCPVCGMYITEEEAGTQTKPWWIVIGAVVMLFVIVFFWIL